MATVTAPEIGRRKERKSSLEVRREIRQVTELTPRQLPPHPVLSAGDGVARAVRFLDAKRFMDLPIPWPRCQDVADWPELPTSDDVVVAVSHDWRYQTHPDPLGEKARLLVDELARVERALRPLGQIFLFLDFISVPQRPFVAGQSDRTVDEQRNFAVALGLMPRIYLHVDAVIHINADWSAVPGDGEEETVKISALDGAAFSEIGDTLQVVSSGATLSDDASAAVPFDRIAAVEGEAVDSLATFRQLREAAGQRLGAGAAVSIVRAPFGRRNTIPAGERGWIYLERFITMVKQAMLEEECEVKVAFSNSLPILGELGTGATRLRGAAKVSKAALNEEMGRFFEDLNRKRFSPTSTDAQQGGARLHGGAAAPAHSSDAGIVRGLMMSFVDDLQNHWDLRMQMQRQRLLLLAVNRGDMSACRELLDSRADPNFCYNGGLQLACLHVAALHNDHGTAALLLSYEADPTQEDAKGRCPAHVQTYFPDERTLHLFSALAPTKEVLMSTNDNGVSVAKRFCSWASTATGPSPACSGFQHYEPARQVARDLEARYPDLFKDCITERDKSSSATRFLRKRYVPCMVRDQEIQVCVWEPAVAMMIDYSVLYLAVNHAPWKGVHENFADFLANRVNQDQPVQFLAVSHDAFQLATSTDGANVEQLHRLFREIFDALPLRGSCILLDDSMGTFTPALWNMGHRLAGVFSLNPGALWDDEYVNTEAHQNFVANVRRGADLFRRRDTKALCSILGTFVSAPPSVLPQLECSFAAAAAEAPAAFWDLCALRISFMETAIYNTMKQRPWLTPANARQTPAVLAYGALSPPALMQRSVERYHELIPGSEVQVISNSKLIPGLEGLAGESQYMEVAELLRMLLMRVAEQNQHRGWLCCFRWRKAVAHQRKGEVEHGIEEEGSKRHTQANGVAL